MMAEVSTWGDSHSTRANNRGVRFNVAIRDYLFRSAIAYNVYPQETELTVTFDDETTVTFPWMAVYTTGFANITTCEVPTAADATNTSRRLDTDTDTDLSSSSPSTEHLEIAQIQTYREDAASFGLAHHKETFEGPVHHLTSNELFADRSDRTVIIDPEESEYQISCFTQSVSQSDTALTAEVQTALVMKVVSFSPDGESYQDAWTGFLSEAQQCLESDYDVIVVDDD